VVTKTPVCGGTDCRLDRGVIIQVNSARLTLREADGRVQAIALSASTKVTHLGRRLPLNVLARRWHVLVTWPNNAPAQSVVVEKIVRGPGGKQGLG
jgi:hypothetical protein